jgi:hypothetical protein
VTFSIHVTGHRQLTLPEVHVEDRLRAFLRELRDLGCDTIAASLNGRNVMTVCIPGCCDRGTGECLSRGYCTCHVRGR